MRGLVEGIILLYQKTLSPYLGGFCRFEPSCSEYTLRAVRTHGVMKGLLLGTWRILRCNPFSAGGWDPVPPGGSSTTDPDET